MNEYVIHRTSDFITRDVQRKTESDRWTQHINFTILYCTVYCTYCILTITYNTNFNHM